MASLFLAHHSIASLSQAHRPCKGLPRTPAHLLQLLSHLAMAMSSELTSQHTSPSCQLPLDTPPDTYTLSCRLQQWQSRKAIDMPIESIEGGSAT